MSLGLIGGIWILISAIYGCLFGKDVIRPWGIIQKYFCCLSISTKHKLLDSFNTLPLVTPTTNYNDNQDKNDCLKKQIENLEEKLTALETFLGEYVVDPSYLKNLINQKPASKDLGGSKTTEVGAVSPVTSVNEYHQRASSILTTTTNITSPTMIINPNMMATPKVPTTSRKSLPPSSINNSSNNDNNWQIDVNDKLNSIPYQDTNNKLTATNTSTTSSSAINTTITSTNVNTKKIQENEKMVKSMKETSTIIAFCEKFHSYLKGLVEFWPEEFEHALAEEAENALVEKIHCVFLGNFINQKKAVNRNAWQRILSETIDEKINQFYQDFNPLRRVNNYYELNIKDKVLILNTLITWQLQESDVIRKAIEIEYRKGKRNQNNDLEVLPFGEDKKGRKYYYFGKGARVYRETIIKNKNKDKTQSNTIWESITTTLEELESYINDTNELKIRVGKDKQLRNMIINEIIPKIKQDIESKEKFNARKLRKEQRVIASLDVTNTLITNDRDNNDHYVALSNPYMTRSKRAHENGGTNTNNINNDVVSSSL
ncbi:8725_t:CDS:2, partial [Entrophospora sp. SA101]